MLRSVSGALLVGSALAALPAAGQVLPSGVIADPPSVQGRIVGDELRTRGDSAIVFGIVVEIPPDHHGYLDEGDEGYYIPLAFDFSELEERGASVTARARPEGERDELAAARVLRGSGRFDFRIEGTTGLSPGSLLHASLTYQICNDVSRVCYPPAEARIAMPIASGRHRP